jgi:hypothetical protein
VNRAYRRQQFAAQNVLVEKSLGAKIKRLPNAVITV